MQELTERSMGLTGSIDVRSGFLQPRAPAAVRPSRSTTAAAAPAYSRSGSGGEAVLRPARVPRSAPRLLCVPLRRPRGEKR